MAAILPSTSNHCRGTTAAGVANHQLKCVKSFDEDDLPVYTCATYRYFKVNCSKINRQCSSLSGAFLPAVTVCGQKMY